MSPTDEVYLTLAGGATIRADELSFRCARSGGPGGQNINKVSTRVTLLFDVETSPSLTAAQKARIRARLASRINRRGVLRVVSSKHRTQAANRRAATQRFVELLSDALRVEKPRKRTSLPASAKRERREEKNRRAHVKQERRAPHSPDDW